MVSGIHSSGCLTRWVCIRAWSVGGPGSRRQCTLRRDNRRVARSGCSLQQWQDNLANGSVRDKPRRADTQAASGSQAAPPVQTPSIAALGTEKRRDIAMEMRSEGCVFKYDRWLPACSDNWAWTWLTANGFRYRRGKCKRRTPIPVVRAVMARWWSVVREFAGQGFVAAERVDGHQFVPPVDSERVQAMGERCLSRPRAHRLVGQFDASAIPS